MLESHGQVCAHTHTCTHIQIPKDPRYSMPLSITPLETRSLTESGAYHCSLTGSQQAPGNPPFSTPHHIHTVLGLQVLSSQAWVFK